MERLRIENFLLIEHADFEVGRFTVFIGSQASGKSIVAKLLYFFRSFLNEFAYNFCYLKTTKKQLDKKIWDKFENIFPKYTWSNQQFELYYQVDDFELVLKKYKTPKGNDGFKLIISKNLNDFYKEIQLIDEKKIIEEFFVENKTGRDLFKLTIKSTIFIPASRSFFAMMQNNIFSLLARDIEVDFFVKQFGSDYESHKRHYNQIQLFTSKPKKIISLVDIILMGRYQYKNEQDWLEKDGKTINVFHASSGQQEALPMLTMLFSNLKENFFIEEPEAHLFPISQKHIVSILGWLYQKQKRDFFITTHSPYILTALNNAILAHDVIAEKGEEAVKDFFDPDYAINYDDVRAYTIENGRVLSVMDDETRLIGGNIIDEVSNEFETVFGQLLDLQG